MKLLLKILFFLLTIFYTNISEAKVVVFDVVVSEIKLTESVVENKNESVGISKNDFETNCKNESSLVDYRNLAKCYEATAAKGGMQATESVIKGFTGHATNQAVTRGFKTADILKIVREGTPVEAMGRYGSQMRYTLGGNTVVVNAQGKVVTLFSNAPGTANGLGKGFFIPFK